MTTKSNPLDILFTPPQVSELTEKSIAKRMEAERYGGLQVGLPLYIPGLDSGTANKKSDAGFVPMADGDMMTIIARPGNGKTSFMMRLARERVRKIRELTDDGDQDAAKRIVVYATWEQTVEQLTAFHLAAETKDADMSITKMAMGKISDAQWEAIQAASVRRMADPLWFVGHSIERRAKRPVITVDFLGQALWAAMNWQGDEERYIIDSVFIDYLQRIPYGQAESKTIGISQNLNEIKNLALSLGTKFIVGVQARREVDSRDDPTPNMEDGQWTSNIEQDSDQVLGIVRPCKYKEDGESFDGVKVQGFSQMKINVCKQKMGDSNFHKWVDFDPRYNILTEAEIHTVNLDEV